MEEAIAFAANEVEANLSTCQFKKGLKPSWTWRSSVTASSIPALLELAQARPRQVRRGAHLNLRIVQALAVLGFPYLPFPTQRLWGLLANDGSLGEGSGSSSGKELNVGRALPEPRPLYRKVEIQREEFGLLRLRGPGPAGRSDRIRGRPSQRRQADGAQGQRRPADPAGSWVCESVLQQGGAHRQEGGWSSQPGAGQAARGGIAGHGPGGESGEKVKVLTPAGPAEPGDRGQQRPRLRYQGPHLPGVPGLHLEDRDRPERPGGRPGRKVKADTPAW